MARLIKKEEREVVYLRYFPAVLRHQAPDRMAGVDQMLHSDEKLPRHGKQGRAPCSAPEHTHASPALKIVYVNLSDQGPVVLCPLKHACASEQATSADSFQSFTRADARYVITFTTASCG